MEDPDKEPNGSEGDNSGKPNGDNKGDTGSNGDNKGDTGSDDDVYQQYRHGRADGSYRLGGSPAGGCESLFLPRFTPNTLIPKRLRRLASPMRRPAKLEVGITTISVSPRS